MTIEERHATRAFELRAVGRVESPLTSGTQAPRQADGGAAGAWLVFDADYRGALRGLQVGQRVIVITWLDRARRDLLSIHPRGDASRPTEGVFNTRSPHRPNPIGLHEVEIVGIDGLRLQLRSLEAIDGTPIVDLKPVLNEEITTR